MYLLVTATATECFQKSLMSKPGSFSPITKESIIDNFIVRDLDVAARSAGSISYAKGWRFENVNIKTNDNSKLDVINCTEMHL